MLAEIDDFNPEIELTRQNDRLMKLLDRRGREKATISRRNDSRALASKGTAIKTAIVVVVLMLLWSVGPVEALIDNIEVFLDKCPSTDPIYTTLRADFTIRRNDVVVGTIPCSGPMSQMAPAEYTDELIVLQGLRAIHYMDLGRSGHLPWTSGTLYAWMKSKIGGINISDTAASSSCCMQFGGKQYIVIRAQDDSNRAFDRTWEGISGNIDLYFHEIRHLDKPDHVSCCGIQLGCDSTYDEADLSPYGIQWWLNKNWLTGNLYVGFSCLAPQRIQAIAQWHLGAINSLLRDRFCQNKPPVMIMPPAPGGLCPAPPSPPAPPTGLQIR